MRHLREHDLALYPLSLGCEVEHQVTSPRLYGWSMCFVGVAGFGVELQASIGVCMVAKVCTNHHVQMRLLCSWLNVFHCTVYDQAVCAFN